MSTAAAVLITIFCVYNYINLHDNFSLCLQLQQFAAVRDTTVVRSVLEQAMAQTRTNIAWLRDNYDTIRDWLQNRGATAPPPTAGSYR